MPEMCPRIKLISDTRSRLQPRPSEGADRKEGKSSGGCWRVCEAVACVPSASRLRGRHMVPTAAMVKR